MHKNLVFKIILFAALNVAVAGHAGQEEVQNQPYLQNSQKMAQEFIKTLGGTLKKELEAGGTESAIAVCKQVAPALSQKYSTDGKVVKRVSLKPRNQALGVPDAWEKEVLERFERDQKSGKPAAELEMSSVTSEEDGRWYRYMKALPVQPMCLQCHGTPTEISAGVKALLAKEYPGDAAVGYSAGEIRGAFSIKRKLEQP